MRVGMKGVTSGDSPGDSKHVSGHPGAEQLGLFFPHIVELEKATWLPDRAALDSPAGKHALVI